MGEIIRTITDEDIESAHRLKVLWEHYKALYKVTQTDAAEAMGFSGQSAIAGYLHCHAALGLEMTVKFASYLGVSPLQIRPNLLEEYPWLRDIPRDMFD